MPRNAYFERYQSPNIIIVPTVNLCFPPRITGSEQITHPIASTPSANPLINCEPITPEKESIGEPSPSVPCNQQNLRFLNTKAFKSTTPGFSENIRNSPSILKNTISTEVSTCNMSQSIKELSTSKFKSRNNLVDLTGFNLIKRDSASLLSRRQDLRPTDDTKIKPDKISTSTTDLRMKITEGSRKYRDLEIRPKAQYLKRSKSVTNSRHLPDYKVCVRDRGIYSPESSRRYKDSHRSIRHYDDYEIKYKRENQLKTKHLLRKKIRIESCETTKLKPDARKKVSEQRQQCIKNEKHNELSSMQIPTNLEKSKNYHNNKVKHQNNSNRVFVKSVVGGDRSLPKNLSQRMGVDGVDDLRSRLSRKRSRSECSEHHEHRGKRLDQKSLVIPVTQDADANSPILAPVVYERKPKTRKPNELINNTKSPNSDSGDSDEDSLLNYFIKHGDEIVASMYDPQHNELEHNKITTDNTKFELVKKIKEQEIIANKKSEIINPKTNHINKIKSIEINKGEISFPKAKEINSINKKNGNDSKSNEETKSQVDLDNQVEKIEEETSLHKVHVNNENEKNKSNEGFIFKVYMRVIKIDSDTANEDTNLEIGSIAYTKKHKDVKNVDQDSRMERNSQQIANKTIDITEELVPKDTKGISENGKNTEQQANITTALTRKVSAENAPKETMSLCKDKQKITAKSKMEINIKQTANNIIDLTGKSYKEILPNETISICKNEQKVITNSKDRKQEKINTIDLTEKACEKIAPKETKSSCKDEQKVITNSKDTKQEAINMIDLTGKACEKIAPNETKSFCKDEQKVITNSKDTKQEAINMIDLTGKACEKIAPKETKSFCKDEQKIINSKNDKNTKQEAINVIDLTEKEVIDLSDSNDSVLEVIDITDTTSKHIQPNINIEQNKSINNPGGICLKDENDNTQDTVEALLETMFNNFEPKGNIRKHIKPNQDHGCTKKSNENSIQKSVDAVEVSLETIFNVSKQHDTSVNMGTQKTISSGQLINKEINLLKTTQATIEAPSKTMINTLDRNETVSNKIENGQSNVLEKHMKIVLKSQESVNQILPETIKTSNKQNAVIKIDADPLNVPNIQGISSQNSRTAIVPLCKPNNTFKEHGQTFEDTVNKPAKNIEKNTLNILPSLLSENKLLLGSDNSTKETQETAKSSFVQNKRQDVETLQKCETIQTSSKTISIGEQKARTITVESNVSDKNTVTKLDKNREEASKQTTIVKAEKTLSMKYKEFITRLNKSDVKNQDKSLEAMKNNTQKLETIKDTAADNKNSNIKIRSIGSELENSEINTDTKKEQEEKDANNSLVPNERKNKNETKPNYQEQQCSPKMRLCISKLESQMSEYLKKNYTVSSLIHCGRFSTIYKCFDTKGETYAVKVVNQRQIGRLMERIYFLLQQHRPRQDSCVLYLMNSFACHNKWCLLTEYFPKNLQQELREKNQGFHIDRVQVLSKQLVDAVNMLTNAGIIHSDIKPAHILLNNASDRLKLCGFDRANFSNYIKIIPSTGTPRYRAPEVILGFQEDHRIDVWSTALVIFEMVTKQPLFDAYYNNSLLYQYLLTFGSFDWSMVERSRFGGLYFSGTSFMRQLGRYGHKKIVLVDCLQRSDYFRRKLFEPYSGRNWATGKSKWQITKEIDKLETLHTLLKQMLVLDPRHRLPIQFVNASEFMNHDFTIA